MKYALVCILCFASVCRGADETPVSANQPHGQVYSCVVHVHSEMSSYGRYSLEKLTDTARGYGVDAVFLTDNLSDTIQYGLPPLRNIFWLNYSRRSVMTMGPRAYLAAVRAENERQSEVLYVPGVEVCPRFYWTGSLRGGDLVCHDHQRNLIVLGCDDPGVIAGIPEARGYLWPADAAWIVSARIILALLFLGGLLLVFMPRFLARRSPYPTGRIRVSILVGIVVPVLVVAVAVNAGLMLRTGLRIYGARDSMGAGQRDVDYLRAWGLVHYWAHPEAFDHHEFQAADGPLPLRALARIWNPSFIVDTRPYPEVLERTAGYTGFGGVYEDVNTLIEPGAAWDRVLLEYLAGDRAEPVWCFGEMLYHYEGQAGKKLRNVETMVWARERTAAALCDSLRNGRFYARKNRADQRLSLDSWAVDSAGVRVAVSSSVPGEKVTVTLVRNGEPAEEFKAETPFERVFAGAGLSAGPAYYRMVVEGGAGLRLVTNPLFLK